MFYWFLKEYETNIYRADDRKIETLYIWEKVLLISQMASLMGLVISTIYQRWSLVIIFLVGLTGLQIVVYYLEKNRREKEIDLIIARFKTSKLEPLMDMLKNEKYSLFGRTLDSKEGINWLKNACSNEIERCKNKPIFVIPIKNFFLTLILPIATYVVGAFASTLSISERFYFSAMFLIILIMIFGFYCMIAPSINDFLTKRIRVIEDLKDNLDYYEMAKVPPHVGS